MEIFPFPGVDSFLYFIRSNYYQKASFHHSSPDRIVLKFLEDLQFRFPRFPALQNSREFQEYTKSAIERIQTFLVLSRIGPAQDVEDRLGDTRFHLNFSFLTRFSKTYINIYPNVSKINFKLLSIYQFSYRAKKRWIEWLKRMIYSLMYRVQKF